MKIVWLCQYPLSDLKSFGVVTKQRSTREATWLRNLASGIVNYYPNIQLHVVTELASISRDYSFNKNGVYFHVIRSASSVPFVNKGYPNYFPLDALLWFRFNKYRLCKCVDEIQPAIVHAHGTESVYSIAANMSGYPYIISLQGIISNIVAHETHLRYKIIQKMERRIIQESHYFVAKTPNARKFILDINPAAVVFDIENPMNQVFLSPPLRSANEQMIVFVGYLAKEKGIEEAIKAVKQIPLLKLAIIGTGENNYERYLRQLIQALDMSDRVIMYGQLEPAAIAEIFSRSLLLVLPSYMENSPNVVSEAMCAGLPVVATRVGGIPNMVNDGITGLLVSPKDVFSLANSINSIISNKALRESMQNSSREEGKKRFHPWVASMKHINAYEIVVNNPSS